VKQLSLIVQKYGGSSVANADLIQNVAKRVIEGYEEGNQMMWSLQWEIPQII
jgi:aspartate kinase